MNNGIGNIRAIVVALIAAGILAACGGTTTTTAPTAQQAGTQPTAAATAASSASQPTAASTSATSAAPDATSISDASAAPAATAAADAATAPTAGSAATAPTPAKLNLNEVTEEQLLSTIPNFPSRMVREFFEYRPYVSIQQFRREIGKYVSDEQVAAYEQFVYVPVDINNADAATIQQLPGVDAAAADALIAARPYASSDVFLAKLAEIAPNADAAQAEAYLAAQ